MKKTLGVFISIFLCSSISYAQSPTQDAMAEAKKRILESSSKPCPDGAERNDANSVLNNNPDILADVMDELHSNLSEKQQPVQKTPLFNEVQAHISDTIQLTPENGSEIAAAGDYLASIVTRMNPELKREDVRHLIFSATQQHGVAAGILVPALDVLDRSYVFGVPHVAAALGPLISFLNPSIGKTLGNHLGLPQGGVQFGPKLPPNVQNVIGQVMVNGSKLPGGVQASFPNSREFGNYLGNVFQPGSGPFPGIATRGSLHGDTEMPGSHFGGIRNQGGAPGSQNHFLPGHSPFESGSGSGEDFHSCSSNCGWGLTKDIWKTAGGIKGGAEAGGKLGGVPGAVVVGVGAAVIGANNTWKNLDRCLTDCSSISHVERPEHVDHPIPHTDPDIGGGAPSAPKVALPLPAPKTDTDPRPEPKTDTDPNPNPAPKTDADPKPKEPDKPDSPPTPDPNDPNGRPKPPGDEDNSNSNSSSKLKRPITADPGSVGTELQNDPGKPGIQPIIADPGSAGTDIQNDPGKPGIQPIVADPGLAGFDGIKINSKGGPGTGAGAGGASGSMGHSH